MDNISKEKLLDDLKHSKRIIKKLEAAIKYDEERNQMLLENERLLSRSAIELVDIPFEDDIYEFAALKLEKLFPESIILVTSCDEKLNKFGVASLKGVDQKIINVLGRFIGEDFLDIKASYTDFDEILQKCLINRRFKELNRGLYSATGQVFSQRVCQLVEKMIGIKKSYGMGLLWDDTLYGAVAIFSRGEEVMDKKDIVETLVSMVSVALQKRQADIEIKRTLEDKEILMKEIHHRAKNNLSVISSLLNLQSVYVTDQNALKILKESDDRAKCMALIHEGLYSSNNLKSINFGEYLRTLTLNLFRSYTDNSQRIKLNLDVENIMLDVNTAVPLGLMVNELVTNSLKYAFGDLSKGEVNIAFKKMDNEFILNISDNGSGFPDDLDFRNTHSLGLQIVNRLTDQISGQIQMHNSKGTAFEIKFKELNYSK
ncbi:sensor histidine kinase [Methanobacterium alcaliphilum]|uniref:sensor histidine kinase n=1 Tax=Methanobacterium alcaliphilum TaxID=392018 RepID=UPI00200A740E|nr:sensor histidine kinase [Methanobacterium alcaliphilum]MCK9151848.1 sensor histidine kinase [Methanobacterium alcaliphilum]